MTRTSALEPITGWAGGVPFAALLPTADASGAPAIVGWHLNDPPRSETALAAALPLSNVPAWRIYLGLPLSGPRLPGGGLEEFFALGQQDAVMNLFEPILTGALAEFPGAIAEIRTQLQIADRPIGLLGGSIGAAVAQLVLSETEVPVAAAVLVSPLIQLRRVVELNERRFDLRYRWSDASQAVAERMDFVARSGDFARRSPQPPILLITGAEDDPGILEPADELYQRLRAHYQAPEHVDRLVIPGMGHPFADEPGLEAAPQTPDAARVDAAATTWFTRHLSP
jgi:pimeloyl-ACP methyl ester carboxylesterase